MVWLSMVEYGMVWYGSWPPSEHQPNLTHMATGGSKEARKHGHHQGTQHAHGDGVGDDDNSDEGGGDEVVVMSLVVMRMVVMRMVVMTSSANSPL